MFTFGNLARRHTYHRPYFSHYHRAEGISPSKKEAMMDAAIYKTTAVVTAGLVGGISAYKGLPEIKNFAGLDVLAGFGLAGAEFYMLWKGGSAKTIAAVGGISTGLLCHWAAVQGTIWGATKARAEGGEPQGTGVAGWDYNNSYAGLEAARHAGQPQSEPAAAQEQAFYPSPPSRGFDVDYGRM